MTSQKRRDPIIDPLLTPENATLVLVDYQPPQVNTIRSIDSGLLVSNLIALAETASLFKLPKVISTGGVESRLNPDTIPQLKNEMSDAKWIDRTSINAWEDADFVSAVKSTGRKKLIFGALWSEVCLAFPVLYAIADGFEVFIPVDCVGGTSVVAHESAIQRCLQAIGSRQGGPWSTEIALKQFASQGLKT